MNDDPSVVAAGPEPVVRLVRWRGPVDDDRPDASYLHAVAGSGLVDPFTTVRTAAARLGVPVGALVRHVLADWAAAGSSALLAAGPDVVAELVAAVRAFDAADDEPTRAAALTALRGRAEWLAAGLEDPAATYPAGGAGPRRRTRIGAYGLATRPGGVLLVQVAEGYPGAGRWTLPGGGLDHGEAPLDALLREVAEETGLVATPGAFLLADSHDLRQRGEHLHLLRLVWRVAVPHDAAVAVQEVDGSTAVARWVALDDLDAHPLLSVAARALAAADVATPAPDRSDGAV